MILDANGLVLPEVMAIFNHFKPLIEEKKLELYQQCDLSPEQIDYILHPDTAVSNISLVSLNKIAQLVFLRSAHSERHDTIARSDKFLRYTNEYLMNLFRLIGDIDDVYPKRPYYDYILINGSLVQDMRYYVQTLINFIELKKVTLTDTTKIVFLTGERDLFDFEDEVQLLDPSPLLLNNSWEKPLLLPKTEDQAAEWIWKQSQLPEFMRNVTTMFVRARKNEIIDNDTGNIIIKRPTTYDTVRAWIEDNALTSGSCLSISMQPYVYYQEATIYGLFYKMGLIEKGFSVDGAGMKEHYYRDDFDCFKRNIIPVLDNFARTIYTEVQNRQ